MYAYILFVPCPVPKIKGHENKRYRSGRTAVFDYCAGEKWDGKSMEKIVTSGREIATR